MNTATMSPSEFLKLLPTHQAEQILRPGDLANDGDELVISFLSTTVDCGLVREGETTILGELNFGSLRLDLGTAYARDFVCYLQKQPEYFSAPTHAAISGNEGILNILKFIRKELCFRWMKDDCKAAIKKIEAVDLDNNPGFAAQTIRGGSCYDTVLAIMGALLGVLIRTLDEQYPSACRIFIVGSGIKGGLARDLFNSPAFKQALVSAGTEPSNCPKPMGDSPVFVDSGQVLTNNGVQELPECA